MQNKLTKNQINEALIQMLKNNIEEIKSDCNNFFNACDDKDIYNIFMEMDGEFLLSIIKETNNAKDIVKLCIPKIKS